MTQGSQPPTRTWIARAFTAVEDVVYVGLGILLAGSAAVLLITAFTGAARSFLSGGLGTEIIVLLDRLLLILLVVGLLYTVQVSFREHAVMPDPFSPGRAHCSHPTNPGGHCGTWSS
jgi:hypothetical protein